MGERPEPGRERRRVAGWIGDVHVQELGLDRVQGGMRLHLDVVAVEHQVGAVVAISGALLLAVRKNWVSPKKFCVMVGMATRPPVGLIPTPAASESTLAFAEVMGTRWGSNIISSGEV